jgi:hypothetical protein
MGMARERRVGGEAAVVGLEVLESGRVTIE